MIEVVRGSVLDLDVDAIVNAANTSMRKGGALDAAVHATAGPELEEELIRLAPNGSPVGEVVVTSGFNSKFKHILHTPGPVWEHGDSGEPEELAACYRNAILAADNLGLASLGFPSISTGVYGYPMEAAAVVALTTVRESLKSAKKLKSVTFALFTEAEFVAFRSAADRLGL